MKKFRLPRKIKKTLRKTIWLYPADEDGSSLSAMPSYNQKEYDLYKSGHFKDLFNPENFDRKAYEIKMFSEIEISDDELKIAVDKIFAKEYRLESLRILREAKDHHTAKKYYHGFVNSFNLIEAGDDHGITACMCVDSAKGILKKKKR